MVYAVISEFNPFHNGHQFLLHQLPRQAEDYTVCIMSGNFVQRGEPAAYSKWERAAAAVKGGADLVVELPLPYVLSNSERFAEAGVQLAAALGVPVTLAFGTEEGQLQGLEHLASHSETELTPLLKAGLEKGLSYGAARQEALEALYPVESALLRSPNNLLAYGYLKACQPLGIPCYTIQRSAPHAGEPAGIYCSASYIRSHPEQFDQYCPFPQGASLNRHLAESGMMTLLKAADPAALAGYANISEGLENRILDALTEASELPELYDRIKTKRYAHSKVRRALCSVLLQLPAGLPDEPPPYLRPLAFNQKGRELLKVLKKTATLPLAHSGRDCEKFHTEIFRAERFATDLRNGWLDIPLPCGEDYRQSPLYLEL